MEYRSKPKQVSSIEEYSTNQIIYFACKRSKHRALVRTTLWDLILCNAGNIFPKLTSYQAAQKFYTERNLNKRKTEVIIDYFWELTKN